MNNWQSNGSEPLQKRLSEKKKREKKSVEIVNRVIQQRQCLHISRL